MKKLVFGLIIIIVAAAAVMGLPQARTATGQESEPQDLAEVLVTVVPDLENPGPGPVAVGGEVYPVDRAAILAPFVFLSMVLAAASLLVTDRRRGS